MIFPNPLNPKKYVVLNSGNTFREYAQTTNSFQVAYLPDYAVVDLTTPPDSRWPGKIAAAAIDVTAEEPLPGPSPLWDLPNVFVTPHTAGETRAYEDNVIDILLENLGRLWKGEKTLRNQVL